MTPRSFALVTTSISLLLIVTASKESADLEKLTCNSLQLVSFNWNLSVTACQTCLSTASYFHLVGPCGLFRSSITHRRTSKGWLTPLTLMSFIMTRKIQGPNLVPCRTPAPYWSRIRVAMTGELHSLLPVSEKVRNPVQHPRWKLIIASLAIRMAWPIRSNAFFKSKSITRAVEPLPSTVHRTVLLSLLSFC